MRGEKIEMKFQRVGALSIIAVMVLGLLNGAEVKAQHGQHPTMPGMKFYLHVYFGDKSMQGPLDTPLDIVSTSSPSKPNQLILLPSPWPSISVLEYLPNAELRQDAVASLDGEPAIQLAIEGPKHSYERWLIAGDSERNRLTSFIGTWRMMGVKTRAERDTLWSQFETEMTRDPVLRARRTEEGKVVELPMTAELARKLPDSPCTIRVLEFMPHYGIDDSTSKAVNQSDKRLNPAAHIEIDCAGTLERRWVFAKFPNYSTGKDSDLNVQVALDCPVDAERAVPDFAFVATTKNGVELWSRAEGKARATPVKPNGTVKITGSQYTFSIRTFVAAAELKETFVSAGKGGEPAILLSMDGAEGDRSELWLSRSKARTLPTQLGPLTLIFDSRGGSSAGGH